ncbi:molecular chaperone Hsp33 [Aerococcus urinaehominis]|uniref:33 kDa chaperonin n=1 Tax=Aerococcus urinaehominis TaxID=128944 RepID=A0A0X8FL00_9LACT|nr:Hsp33 family molecular chaperone HslO [Aerococcus urinaehominis]AMB99162.1 molecular chaperone Hsp33 [Aerococcus urinaehominis]SDM05847.1 molecular chaperone Hsp33 [Aerococcus urinaehominis]
MPDTLYKALAFDGQIRATAVVATDTVREAQTRHDSWSASTAAMGRTIAGTLLLASNIKDDAKMTVQISGDGPAGKIVATADGQGHVKAYVDQPHVSLEPNAQGKIDVRGAVGQNGSLSVIKDLGLGEPFQGQVPLISGELAEDFTYYLTVSEQTPSAVGLGVLVDTDETVINAGGWMVQVMPGATEETISQLEIAVAQMPQLTELLSDGYGPAQVLYQLLGEDNVQLLEESPVSFHCECSKERFAAGLATLNSQDIQDMIDEDGGAEAVCHFCNEKYFYDEADLKAIMDEAQ